MIAQLIDERTLPPLRLRLGHLLATSRTACIAITQLRLAGLDLNPGELSRLERCRIIIGRVDAAALLDATTDGSGSTPGALLKAFAASGRLELRTAPHHVWNPDFSIFRGASETDVTMLAGAHYFGRPYPLFGLALTCVLSDAETARRTEARFEELWQAGYDVLPVVVETLDRLAG